MRIAEPLDRALEHTRYLLFRPFDFTKWVCFGVIIFLNVLFGDNPATGFAGQGWGWSGRGVTLPENLDEAVRRTWETIERYFPVIVGVGTVVLFFYLLFMVLFTWVTSRGQLMLVRAVALPEHRIDVNWRATRPLHGTLFMFRLVVNLLGVLYYGSLAGWAALIAVNHGPLTNVEDLLGLLWLLIPAIILWALGATVLWMTRSLLWNFVVPIMVHMDLSCLKAWGIFLGRLWGNIIPIHLYYLAKFGLYIVMGIVTTLTGCFTCFIGVLPVVHHTILAPLYVFERAFSLYVLESMGPEFAIVRKTETDADPFGEYAPRDFTR